MGCRRQAGERGQAWGQAATFHTLGFKAALGQVGRGGLAHCQQTEVRAGRCAQVETRGDLFDRERGFLAQAHSHLHFAGVAFTPRGQIRS